jgi:hypothetical protein
VIEKNNERKCVKKTKKERKGMKKRNKER